MWFTLSDQTAYFLWSLVLGAAAGALYDLLCALRALLKAGRLCILISDVLFFALLGAATSLFALPIFGAAVDTGKADGSFLQHIVKGNPATFEKNMRIAQKFF